MELQTLNAAVRQFESLVDLPLPEVAAQVPAPLSLAPPIAATSSHDIAFTLATEIAIPDLAQLSAILEPHLAPQIVDHVKDLTRELTLALAEGDRTRALVNLQQIASNDPHTLPVLAPEKLLETIRPEVDHLLNRLTTVARMDAEGWLSQADHAVESAPHHELPNWQTKPEVLLNVAHRLFDAGGYTNYIRTADLSQSILNYGPVPYSPFVDQYAEALAPSSAAALKPIEDDELTPGPQRCDKEKVAFPPKTFLKTVVTPRLLVFWRRAPLLVLLLGWLSAGLVGGPIAVLLRAIWPGTSSLVAFGFQLWGTGFLALVCLGFYARIREIRD